MNLISLVICSEPAARATTDFTLGVEVIMSSGWPLSLSHLMFVPDLDLEEEGNIFLCVCCKQEFLIPLLQSCSAGLDEGTLKALLFLYDIFEI